MYTQIRLKEDDDTLGYFSKYYISIENSNTFLHLFPWLRMLL